MRKLLFNLLFLLQMDRIYRFFNRDKITIITYHGFTDKRSFDGIENNHRMHLNIGAFRRHLKYLRSYYNVVSLNEVLAYYAGQKKLPKNAAVVTIDDGYQSSYTLAYPALKEFNMPASVFVATNFVNNKEPLWYDRIEYAVNAAQEPVVDLTIDGTKFLLALGARSEKLDAIKKLRMTLKSMDQGQLLATVKELEQKTKAELHLDGTEPAIYTPLEWWQITEMLESSLISVGSHTESHLALARCDGKLSQEELSRSQQIIERETGQRCDTFCYPNGAHGDFDQRTRQQLEENGYRCGLTTVPGINHRNANTMELTRLGGPEDLAEFAVTVSGFRMFLARQKWFFNKQITMKLSGASHGTVGGI